MSVFKATPIAGVFKGTPAYSATGTQPDTGPYKLRVLAVEDTKGSESGCQSHKVQFQVIDAPWNKAMIGRKTTDYFEPPQPGKTPAKIGKADGLEVVEGVLKQYMIAIGVSAEKVNAMKANFQLNASYYVDKDGNPREVCCFYEAYAGEGTKSRHTYLDPEEFGQVVDKSVQIKLRNAPGQGGGNAGGVGGGTTVGDLVVDDPIENIGGVGDAGAPSGGGGTTNADGLDDLLDI